MMRSDAASIPIRHAGILAKRASTWPRDHFWRTRRRDTSSRADIPIPCAEGHWERMPLPGVSGVATREPVAIQGIIFNSDSHGSRRATSLAASVHDVPVWHKDADLKRLLRGEQPQRSEDARSPHPADAIRHCRRGHRVNRRLAAVHESGCGTKRPIQHVRCDVSFRRIIGRPRTPSLTLTRRRRSRPAQNQARLAFGRTPMR
jgi:hypothetical protein